MAIRRAYYHATIEAFLLDAPDRILGELVQSHNFTLEETQRAAWLGQIRHLREQLVGCPRGEVFFEFAIPRIGKRVDVVVLAGDVVFVLEYKYGSQKFDASAIEQVLDYAVDLKNFHEGSHNKHIVPILVATAAARVEYEFSWFEDRVALPLRTNGTNLGAIIAAGIASAAGYVSEPDDNDSDNDFSVTRPRWSETGYRPTPTIIEAAQALYAGHRVEEISRSDAGADNLARTSAFISKVVAEAKSFGRKTICFITGVPGAGKTLAGLNIATSPVTNSDEHAVFLSGNGPLVDVLREALARDDVQRSVKTGARSSKASAHSRVGQFVQNIHHFRDEGLRSDKAPFERVVIFDEAQRAWDQPHAEKFMKQKRGQTGFEMSEPEFLIDILNRHEDWCTIVCLVGGGQEINSGEAGISEWLLALKKRFAHWHVYYPSQLDNPIYSWGHDLKALLRGMAATEEPSLHLAVSMRSFRSETVSDFVAAVISGDASRARKIRSALGDYPIAVTRDISTARDWLRRRMRGTERIGLVASSGATRLKPEGIFVRAKIEPTSWFLNEKHDVRSSYALEDVGTEFDVQGLELDWIGVCWDADFRMQGGRWAHYTFKGAKWMNVLDQSRQTYLSNAYRVLLTRARQGMVIFVPAGSAKDETRTPAYYDETYEFLMDCGIEPLEMSPKVI